MDNKLPSKVANIVLIVVIISVSFITVLFKSDVHLKVSDALSKKDAALMKNTQVQSVTKSLGQPATSTNTSVPGLSNPGSGAMDGTPEENKKFIWDYLTSHGLSEMQAAAALGSMQVETGGKFKGHTIEGDFLQSFPPWDHDAADYAKCDAYCLNFLFPRNSSLKPNRYLHKGQHLEGIGIAQWTAGRHAKLIEFAAKNNSTWDNLELQCMMVIHEVLKGAYRSTVYNKTVNASSVEEAAFNWRKYYEAGGSSNSFYGKDACMANAKAIYNQLHK